MLNLCHCRASARGLSMRQTFLQAFVPKFDKVPWLSEASLVNKPLVLSIPGRYPSSATVLTLSKKDMDLPNLLQVPDVILKVQPKNFIIPDHEKPSFQNSVNPRVMLLRHPDVQQFNHPCNDIPTESIRYRLPIMGPRTAIFHSLLSGAYKTPQETQDLSFPRKKLMNKTVKQ
ncbi:uncharacterized protein C1orf105 homolog isoform X3 [Arvicola amphibius]|uniref:uncharacterized protein C1orf105 homolog isoform X3 n=1 Tax=Arvicola amphibius TaxID=1047088 RepID=UPI0018E35A33|nr:uncharacterized protein C1orf105 homolog isoform X3 [Arvicola amphibius]